MPALGDADNPVKPFTGEAARASRCQITCREPMRNKMLRACGILAAAVGRFQKRLERLFLSKRENDKRASQRALSLDRKTTEAERLDRLRNPSRYQGR